MIEACLEYVFFLAIQILLKVFADADGFVS